MARKKKEGAVPDWLPADQGQANLQGWGVFECLNMGSTKVFYEIQSFGVRFENDNFARLFVAAQHKAGDVLAVRALRAVFRSKAGVDARSGK